MKAAVEEIEIDKAAMLFKLLGDKTRLSMIKLLENNDCCVCEFVAIFGISQSAISQHLRKLRELGLVNEQRKGQWIFFSLNPDSELYDMLLQGLAFLPDQDALIERLEEQGLRVCCS